MFSSILNSNRKKALAVASAGAYFTAVYVTYQFVTPNQPQETDDLDAHDTTQNAGGGGGCCCCHTVPFTQDPKRTQQFQEIAQTYDQNISRDELVMGIPLLRRALLYFHAKGNVLEVGAGTGRNLDYYPSSVQSIVLTDNSDQMLLTLRKKIQSKTSKFKVFVADAANMTQYYPENSFDTVVDTFGLCSFDDPVKVLKELQRICKPGGKIL